MSTCYSAFITYRPRLAVTLRQLLMASHAKLSILFEYGICRPYILVRARLSVQRTRDAKLIAKTPPAIHSEQLKCPSNYNAIDAKLG